MTQRGILDKESTAGKVSAIRGMEVDHEGVRLEANISMISSEAEDEAGSQLKAVFTVRRAPCRRRSACVVLLVVSIY